MRSDVDGFLTIIYSILLIYSYREKDESYYSYLYYANHTNIPITWNFHVLNKLEVVEFFA